MIKSIFHTIAIYLMVLNASPAEGAPPTVDVVFAREAGTIVSRLRDRGYKNVGVLKFGVSRGVGPVDDSAGALNHVLATRLAIALVLNDDLRAPLGHVKDASALAATLPGADHRTQAGRRAFFQGRYPLAWGDSTVTPDVLITGTAILDADRRAMTVTIVGFDATGEPPFELARLRASTDAPTLASAGESFITRGGGAYEAADAAVDAASGRSKNALQDDANPLVLTIAYDGQPQSLVVERGRIKVREPREDEVVEFILAKRDDDPRRYGVVLTVDGRNTLFHERKPPEFCAKWLLGPGLAKVTVRGYHEKDGKVRKFRVLSDERSRQEIFNYQEEAGTIGVFVYPERLPQVAERGDSKAASLNPNVGAVARATYPEKTPKSASALAAQLRHDGREAPRGLIVDGRALDAPLSRREVDFEDRPVASATIHYYSATP